MAPKHPGKDAGQISPRTVEKRGSMPLTADQRRHARFLRFDVGMDYPDVAAAVGRAEPDVRHALANTRTALEERKRGTVNVSPAAIERLRSLQLPSEAMWQTMNRLLGL